MIKLSRLADYGVVILAEMARSGTGTLSTASALSTALGLPEPTVSKVLKLLCSGGVLGSIRGMNGGYFLKETPERIPVVLIVTALDGPITLTTCVSGHNDPCAARDRCSLSGCWDMVNAAIHTALESLTLADMLAESRRSAERMAREEL